MNDFVALPPTGNGEITKNYFPKNLRRLRKSFYNIDIILMMKSIHCVVSVYQYLEWIKKNGNS